MGGGGIVQLRLVVTNNKIDGKGSLECFVPCEGVVSGKQTTTNCSVSVADKVLNTASSEPSTMIYPEDTGSPASTIDPGNGGTTASMIDPDKGGSLTSILDPEDSVTPTSSIAPDNGGSSTSMFDPENKESPTIETNTNKSEFTTRKNYPEIGKSAMKIIFVLAFQFTLIFCILVMWMLERGNYVHDYRNPE